jgi:hypothetical protein
MRSITRLIISALTVLAIAAYMMIFGLALPDYGELEANTQATKEHLAELKQKLDTGTLIVWKRDSSVTRVVRVNLDTSKIHHKELNRSVDVVSSEDVVDRAIMVLPPRSSVSDDYGNITRYRKAALVFTDPGYDNYFKAPIH